MKKLASFFEDLALAETLYLISMFGFKPREQFLTVNLPTGKNQQTVGKTVHSGWYSHEPSL